MARTKVAVLDISDVDALIRQFAEAMRRASNIDETCESLAAAGFRSLGITKAKR